ncbi:MAG TPA: cytochrome P450 [Streptosporangiaceae bacterium]|nr:cytochrome P450 [Streptosporangiaceae bacterium]
MTTSVVPMGIPGLQGGQRRQWRKAYEADPIGYLARCRQEHGDVFMLEDSLVVITDPALVQRVLVRTNRELVPNPKLLDGGGLPDADEVKAWMHVRDLAGQILKPAALRAHLPGIDQAVTAGLHQLSGRQFDPVAVAGETCLRASLPIWVPHDPPGLVPALLPSVTAGLALSDVAVRIPRWWPSLMRRRIRAARHAVDAQLHALLDSSPPPPAPGQPPTLLRRLVATAGQIPTEVAMKALGNALTSGIATMGGAWCWLLYHLASHPGDLDQIRCEAAGAAGDPTASLPYTTAFVREVLRVHPPAWLLGRDTTVPVTLDEHYTVPPHTAVLFSPYLLHHDPRWWDRPGRFDAQRWLGSRPPHAPYAYLPFGAGPRVCLGLHLGQLLLVRTAAHIATAFDLHLTRHPPAVPPRLATLLLPTGLTCTLTPRGRAARPRANSIRVCTH